MKDHPPEFWTQRAEVSVSLYDLLLMHGYISLALTHASVAHSTSSSFALELLIRLEHILIEADVLEPADIRAARDQRYINGMFQ